MSDILPREDVETLLRDGDPSLGACAVLLLSDAALRKERDDLRDWMKCANKFAWSHETTCPRHDADEPCKCGLDQFLGRPRLYIESWKARVETLEKELAEVRRGYTESIEARTSR